MRTTARNISQITKFISPSVFKLSLGTAIENRDIFMFPEPSLTLKKEQEGVASEEQVYNLISQIFNYDIKSRNLYFVKLEMRMLLQELKEAVNAAKGDRRELINSIYNETAEIVFHDGFINKNDYWNIRIENIKNKAETIINFNKQNHNQINSYSFKPYIKKPKFNLFEAQSFENVFNTAKNINNISVLGNSLFKPVKNIITSSQREPWQKDAYEFYNIYKSMDEKEKKEFLKSISMTEYDIVSVKRMTKEQWNVFLQNVLPHVSLYIKKSEDNINLQNYIQQNHNLSYVLDMTQNQWLNFKTALLNNTDNNLNSLKQFFKNTVEENNSFAKWEIEKKNFINFVYNNKYESFVNEAVKSAEFYKSQNNEFNQNNMYFTESETDEMSYKLTEWMTYLTESKWNEVKTVLTKSKETEYIKPVLEIIKSQKAEETEPQFSAEKRRVIEYIKNNKKLSVEILRKLAEKDEIKKELTGWVDLKVLDKKTTEFNETARKNILNENIEVNKNSEEISPNSEVINNLSAQFTEWMTYLTESKWNEVKTVLTKSKETEYIKPVLEIIKSQKAEETEPEFSAEKRSVIEYIKNNKKLSVEILRKLAEKEEIKKELTGWVDLKVLDKKTTEVDETVRKNILKENIETNKNTEEIRENSEVINSSSTQFIEWLTYLTESQWNEVKTVLTANEEAEYIKPVLEIIKSQKTEETEPEFSAEKRRVIEYIKNNKKLSVEILRELAEKDEIKKELTGWVDLKVLDKKTTEVNKTTLKNILNKNYEIDKNIKEISENSKVINNSSAQLTEWITYLTESQWNEVKTVLTANEETEYIKPVLEIIKSQKTEETEPEFSAEKRRVIEYIKNNKKLSVEILQRLSENEEIKKELENWVDLKELKNEEFRLNKSKITPKTDISGFYLNGKYITNASENLAKWLEYTTKSQWNDIKAFINTQKDNEYLKPVLNNVNIQTAENDENAFNEQKKEFIRQIVNNKEYANNFINLAAQNKGINDIITDLEKKAEINSFNKSNEIYKSSDVEKVLTSNKTQITKANNETIKRILNWAYNTESNSEVKRQIRNKFVNEVRNEVKYDGNILNSSYSTSNKFFEKVYKKRKEAIPQIMSQSYTAKSINSAYIDDKLNTSMAQNSKYFSANLINRINSGSAENELSQYTTADLVIAKSNNVKGAVKNPVKMPDITTQVQQAVKTQVNDIIKINKSSEIQQSENKTIYELTKRINLQQKEIENIITNQRQMLKITDISVVAEKVMNQMQSQLRLEKMRRGL